MEAFLIVFLVSRKRVERLREPDAWSLISFLVNRKRVERLTEPDVWKPFLIVLTTFTLQIWVGTAAIGKQTLMANKMDPDFFFYHIEFSKFNQKFPDCFSKLYKKRSMGGFHLERMELHYSFECDA
jgi:hypothetical protein